MPSTATITPRTINQEKKIVVILYMPFSWMKHLDFDSISII